MPENHVNALAPGAHTVVLGEIRQRYRVFRYAAANHVAGQSGHLVLEFLDVQALRPVNDNQTAWTLIPFPAGWWASC